MRTVIDYLEQLLPRRIHNLIHSKHRYKGSKIPVVVCMIIYLYSTQSIKIYIVIFVPWFSGAPYSGSTIDV